MQIKLGLEEWRRLSKEIERISQNEDLELLINMTFGFSTGEENEEDEGHHHHHHITEVPKEALEEITQLINTLESKYGAKIDHHIHGDHVGVLASIITKGSQAINIFRDVVSNAKNCDYCFLASLDGEFHLGNDVSVIFFGDGYKITFILPHQDGRRLVIMELNV